jgi:hypothetical protein
MQGEFSIFDMRGARLRSGIFDDDKIEVNVQGFKKGIYMAAISSSTGWISKKFIVIR